MPQCPKAEYKRDFHFYHCPLLAIECDKSAETSVFMKAFLWQKYKSVVLYLHRGPEFAASSLSFVVFIVFWNRKFRRDFLDFRCKSHQVSSWSAVVVQKRPSSSKFTVRTESWKREKKFCPLELTKRQKLRLFHATTYDAKHFPQADDIR